jgi:hypothetical protein
MAHDKYIPLPSEDDRHVNDEFVQLYEDHLPILRKVIKESPQAAQMLLWMFQHMNEYNALVVSQQALAEALECHKNTIGNHVKYLKDIKAIYTLKSGASNVYYINKEIAWKNYANKKRYAKFGAAIILSESEQEPDFKQEILPHFQPKKRPGRPRKATLEVQPKPTKPVNVHSAIIPGLTPEKLEWLREVIEANTTQISIFGLFTCSFYSTFQAISTLL